VALCSGYCRENCFVLCVLYVIVCVFCGYCREQCVCAVGTVGNIGYVLWVL